MSKYKNQHVRDLAWVIASPALMSCEDMLDDEFFKTEYKKVKSWLNKLDKSPKDLDEYIKLMNRYGVGSYFEQLISFWLQRRDHTDLIGKNIQVQEDEYTTIGEYDFIFNDHGITKHWEVAIKFYLSSANDKKWNTWLGPKGQDRLDLKLEKLINKQSKLSQTDAGAERLKELDVTDVKPEIFLKGCFFYHHSDSQRVPPARAGKDHLKGWWCRVDNIEEIIFKSMYWGIIQKPYWLSPAQFEKKDVKSSADMLTLLRSSKLPFMVAVLDDDGLEIERGFVVEEGWPNNS